MLRVGAWLVAIGQIGLWTGLLGCYFLDPKLIQTTEHGVSNYGVHSGTILLYSLAFVVVAVCMALAGYTTMHTAPRLATAFYILSGLYLAVLITTYAYHQSQHLRDIHIAAGVALYSAQLLLSMWFIVRTASSFPATTLLAIQCGGALLSFVSLIHVVPLLFVGQIITGVSFGVLLVYMTARILLAP